MANALLLFLLALQGSTSLEQQAYLKASNTGAGDSFGWSVAVSGNVMVVGARYEASQARGVNGNQASNTALSAGAAYVFVREGDGWRQDAYLKASNTDPSDTFGWSVAVSGGTVVVGAPGEDSSASGVNGEQGGNHTPSSGAAYVFVRGAAGWRQEAYLKASNTGAGDQFGYAVAIDGDTLVVGAPQEWSSATGVNGDGDDNGAPRAGAAYVFTRHGERWSQRAYLKASNTDAQDQFGLSVAVDRDTIVVGAFQEGSSATGVDGDQGDNAAPLAGAAYVFTRGTDGLRQEAYLKASNTDAGDLFGISVAASGDTILVGASAEDSDATGVNGDETDDSLPSAGAVYAFRRAAAGWSQEAYLKASNTDANDLFGIAVALCADTAAVGAHWEASAATGVNGDQADNSAPMAGAAYAFGRTGSTWSQLAYLKGASTDPADQFAYAVGISGDTVAVGVRGEASSAVGVNGDPDDNGAGGSGAAYVYVDRAPSWSLVPGSATSGNLSLVPLHTWHAWVPGIVPGHPVRLSVTVWPDGSVRAAARGGLAVVP